MRQYLFSILSLLAVMNQASALPASTPLPRHNRHRSMTDFHRRKGEVPPGCTAGAWQCLGNDLQRCDNGGWLKIATCPAATPCGQQGDAFDCVPEAVPVAQGEVTHIQTTDPSAVETKVAPTPSTLPTSSIDMTLSKAEETKTTEVGPSAAIKIEDTVPSGTASEFKRVIYSDWNVLCKGEADTKKDGTCAKDPDLLPSPARVKGYTHLLLSFWMVTRPSDSQMGEIDKAAVWSKYSAEEKKALKAKYKEVGVTLMVSAFGGTDTLPSTKGEAVKVAAALAKFVKDNDLDGVDVDYEETPTEDSIKWLITFQAALRGHLPPPYLISHAPQAPWFGTNTAGQWKGGYKKVHKEVGTGIDFYNPSLIGYSGPANCMPQIQYYNQGSSNYKDCPSIFGDTSASYPGTSVFEIHKLLDIPLDKLVVGKPLLEVDSTAGGYMTPEIFGGCLKEGQQKKWNGGFMYWQWNYKDGPAAVKAITV